jgi:hypothetical protein
METESDSTSVKTARKCTGVLSHPCYDTGPGPYSGPPDGLPAHLRHTPEPPRAITVQLRTSTRITPRIGAPDNSYGLPASSPDQDYALRCNSDVLQARTGPLPYTKPLRPTPDLLRTSMRISTSTSDFLIIPGVLRTTSALIRTNTWTPTSCWTPRRTLGSRTQPRPRPDPLQDTQDCIRTTAHLLALTSDFPGGLSGRQSIPDALRNISALLRLSSDLRHISYAVSELWIRATILGITPMDSASDPDLHGLHGMATPPS